LELREKYLKSLKKGIKKQEKELKNARANFKKTVLGNMNKKRVKGKDKANLPKKTESTL